MVQEANQQAISSGASVPPSLLEAKLPDLLRRAAQGTKGICYHTSDGSVTTQTYAELLEAAQRVLQGLRNQGVQPQERVILHGGQQALLTAFWGCVLGGFVPVPIAVAPDYETETSKTAVLRHAAELLDHAVIVTEAALQASVQQFCNRVGLTSAVLPIESLLVQPAATDFHLADLDDLALISFTSGSTGVPKGVMLNGRNMLVVAYGMATVNRLGADSVSLNWMPLEHVASLVMFHVTQVYLGCQQIQVASERILQDPLHWLDLVHQYRVSHTWAPNFAYGLINERAAEVAERAWDLSCLRWMGNGAEAVVGKTTRCFLELLMPLGLGATVVSPGYGMSETCSGIVHSHRFSLQTSSDQDAFVEVGLPTPGVSLRIVDDANQVLPEGAIGRLQVQGLTVMQGYYQRPDLNAQVFTPDGWFDTGDLGFLNSGRLTLTGRQKEQIVINGVNYYSHDVEAAVEELSGVEVSFTAACAVRRPTDTTDQLVIFFVPTASNSGSLPDLIKAIRRQVVQVIGIAPSFVVPVSASEIPKTNLGKIQRRQLAERFVAGEFDHRMQQMQQASSSVPEPLSQLEQQIAQIWQTVLGLAVVSIRDNFFEIGGTSLLLMQALQRLQQAGHNVSAVTLFQHPTIAALANHLRQNSPSHQINPHQINRSNRSVPPRSADGTTDIAVIGMSCRFPGANTIEQFWQNLCHGVESIQWFSDAEILASGVDPHLLQHPNYVKASPILDCDITTFDAEFFGYSPKEASLLDPQQRLLLECAWESLEDAGYNPLTYTDRIGLYAGAAMNTYLLNHVYPNRAQLDEHDSLQVLTLSSMGGFQLTTANDKDYLTTRVSYKLNLTGPSVNVQTACSTSLVTVHLARQSLLNGECEIALAGGVSVHTPQKAGHLYQDGMILSPDGHCRAFDAKAAGTIFGSGAGVVVLKRLDQAIADGDQIYAVIKGSAIGNDGSEKVGYFAPQAAGQARVTAEALATAGVEPATIGYVEAHGTGTALGDPIELAGLTQAFATENSQPQQRCAIGSVKTNVGHLNIASGIVGLIKTLLCLHHKQIPPSLHFETPNPQIDFANSPFYVNTQLQEWQSESIRRASVNSLGIGGTNAHIVLEESPKLQIDEIEELQPTHYLFTLSAKSEAALRQLGQQYAEFLASHPDLALADVCFTASAGRAHFQHRLSIVAASLPELQQKLANWTTGQAIGTVQTQIQDTVSQPIAFLFAGQGCQYAGMGQELYQSSPVFRAALDRCDAILQSELGGSILEIIWTGKELDQTIYTQPALFAIEYALAQLWISWGINPTIVIGHSVGEYVAACIAGVFSLEDGLKLIAARGRLIQSLPSGAMAAVMADRQQVQAVICNFDAEVTIAAVNSEENVVIAGSVAAVEQAIKQLTAQGYKTKLLTVSHAFHSPLMQPIIDEFTQVASQVQYSLPHNELISNLTGEPATAAIASPEYWCQHLLQPVRFADGMTTLHHSGCKVLLECSPKPLLLSIARSDARFSDALFISSLSSNQTSWYFLCYDLSHLYGCGIDIDWNAFYNSASRHRLSLPTYSFQRRRYWLDAPSPSLSPASSSSHPLLGQKVRTPLKATLFQTQLSANAPAFLGDHRVQQQVVVPAAAFIEMALSGAKSVLRSSYICLENVAIPQALVLSGSLQTVQLVIDKEIRPKFEIYSLADAETEDWTLHCSGQINYSAKPDHSSDAKSRNLNQLQQWLPYRYSAAEHYQRCQAQGLNYGASFQAVRQIWWREGEALGEIRLPASLDDDITNYCLHPVLLDAAFQVIAALLPDYVQSFTYIPVELKQLDWLSPDIFAEVYWSYVCLNSQYNSHNHDSKFLIADIELLDQSGNLIAKIEHLKLQRLNQLDYQLNQQPSLEWRNWLYQVNWRLQPRSVDFDAAANSDRDGLWLIFADQQGVAEQLAAQLRRVDQPYQLVFLDAAKPSEEGIHLDSSDPAAFEQLLVQLGQQTSLRGVIHLWSLDCPDIESGEPHGKTAVSAVKPSCESALYLMQALTSVVLPRLPDCWFVTCGAESVGDRMTTQPLQACLWGLGKVFALEHPEFSTALIDLDPSDLKHAALELFNEIQSGVAAEQVSFCRDQRYIAQLVQLPQQTESPAEQSNPTRLEIGQRGTLENLNWQPVKRQSPAPDQVEIRVQATGLNFRDLLNALGRLPDGAEHYQYPGEAGLLGLECAGEVVAVGSEVKNFAIGDTVVAVAAGSFSQFVTVNAALVAHKPKGLDFTAAATMPTAFLTAFHALVELAQIKAGDRVLIHAAAGGVGQAAIQIAQQAGAEVLATAAPEKWSFLQAQGIQHVFNSRQFDVDAVMNATKNQGVDIVLNSLTGEAISQSLSVLRSMGRFVEIGKTDVWQPAQVAAARPDIKYFLVDLFELTQQQPERIQAMMKQLLPQFQDQRLKPLPQTVFPTAQAIDAFRYMQQAKHIGKIVIRQPEIRQSNSLAPLTRFQIREDGAYLITGGLGGLGLELAEWLISRGAAYLILVNRSAPSASVQTTLEQLQQRARVDVIQADISDATQAANLLANSAPLLGIFHAAGTLADAALEQQTWNHFETVMAAKVQGAWNLHYLTREMQLDCFVLFSSAASLIGSAGQANYAAANAFLDALSHYRQQLGLPSLSINWGGWSQVGMTAERQLEAEMVAKGLGTIPPEQGLTALEYLLDQPLAQVGVLPIDWSSWQAPAAAFFREVARAPEPKPLTMQPMLQLKHLSPSECRSQLIAYLNAQVGKILGIEAASIDPQQGLTEIGIDSLTSVELRNLLQTHLNCRLPSTLLFDYPTIAGLAEHLINLLLPEAAQSSQQTAQQTAQQMVKPETAIAHLSEAEAEALLLQELEQLEN